jgi:hypothetical protein
MNEQVALDMFQQSQDAVTFFVNSVVLDPEAEVDFDKRAELRARKKEVQVYITAAQELYYNGSIASTTSGDDSEKTVDFVAFAGEGKLKAKDFSNLEDFEKYTGHDPVLMLTCEGKLSMIRGDDIANVDMIGKQAMTHRFELASAITDDRGNRVIVTEGMEYRAQ